MIHILRLLKYFRTLSSPRSIPTPSQTLWDIPTPAQILGVFQRPLRPLEYSHTLSGPRAHSQSLRPSRKRRHEHPKRFVWTDMISKAT